MVESFICRGYFTIGSFTFFFLLCFISTILLVDASVWLVSTETNSLPGLRTSTSAQGLKSFMLERQKYMATFNYSSLKFIKLSDCLIRRWLRVRFQHCRIMPTLQKEKMTILLKWTLASPQSTKFRFSKRGFYVFLYALGWSLEGQKIYLLLSFKNQHKQLNSQW